MASTLGASRAATPLEPRRGWARAHAGAQRRGTAQRIHAQENFHDIELMPDSSSMRDYAAQACHAWPEN
jgi:hypothetical protein